VKNTIWVIYLLFLSSLSLAQDISLFEKHQAISQEQRFFKTYSLEDTIQISNELISYSEIFHQNLVDSLNAGKVLHGKQLTTFHEIGSYFIGINQRLNDFIKQDDSRVVTKAKLEQLNSFFRIYYPFYENDKFRRFINDEDLSFGITRFQIHNAIMSLLDKEKLQDLARNSRNQNQHYSDLIRFIKNESKINALVKNYKRLNRLDLKVDRNQDLAYNLSRDFGNTVGRVRWRKGYLWKNQAVLEEIYENLKPLDIITEKTYFALTDRFIPGHFGHNAIWLGTKDQLEEIGMWHHPAIIPYQEQIAEGKSIIEVDRSGSHLKTLKDFMNVDELAIIRVNRLSFSSINLERTYNILLAQLGKIYDFNFDVETTDTLVCSELIYQSFEEIFWPTEDYLGRTTISPDNVASLALYNNPPVDLVYYAAQKSKNDFKYKNLDDLASDVGFKKVGQLYKKTEKKCRRRGRRRICHEVLIDLEYSDHDLIPNLDLTW
tara:strand:- start:7668 stop:9134 length:1467 start_codon:yes stop_codon:yes gene_type:complete